MIKITAREQAQALVNLSRTPDWKHLVHILTEEEAYTLETLTQAQDESAMRRAQGRAQLLKEIRAMVATAPDALEKMSKR